MTRGQTQIYGADGSVKLASAAKVDDVYFQGTATPKFDMSLTNNLPIRTGISRSCSLPN
jgi:hypothetical protein